MSHRLNPSLNRIPRNLAALQSSSGYEGVAHPVLEIVNYSILHSSDRHISIPGKYRSVHLYFAGQLPLPPPFPLRNQSPRIIRTLYRVCKLIERILGRVSRILTIRNCYRFVWADVAGIIWILSASRWPSITTAPFLQTYECRNGSRHEGFAKERRSRRSLIRWKNRLNFRELLILFIAEVTFKKGEIGC